MIKCISVYLNLEDDKIIEEASKIASLNKSSFCRFSAIQKARKILEEKADDTTTRGTNWLFKRRR